jgi:hypothetical protein
MSIRFAYAVSLAVSLAGFGLSLGCSRSAPEPTGADDAPVSSAESDYNPHDVPITEQQKTELREQTAGFADALATIKQLRDEVQRETAAGIPEDPYKAHQALDKADLVLQWLPEIARNSDIPKEHWEAVNTTANDLRTLFEQVHQNIDNQQDPDFAAVAGEIDQKLAGLQEIAAAQPSDTAAES